MMVKKKPKFKLTETFLLSERFTLNEADNKGQNELLDKLDQLIENTQKLVDDSEDVTETLENIENNLSKGFNQLKQTGTTLKQLSNTLAQLVKFQEAAEIVKHQDEILKTVGEYYETFKDIINTNSTTVKNTSSYKQIFNLLLDLANKWTDVSIAIATMTVDPEPKAKLLRELLDLYQKMQSNSTINDAIKELNDLIANENLLAEYKTKIQDLVQKYKELTPEVANSSKIYNQIKSNFSNSKWVFGSNDYIDKLEADVQECWTLLQQVLTRHTTLRTKLYKIVDNGQYAMFMANTITNAQDMKDIENLWDAQRTELEELTNAVTTLNNSLTDWGKESDLANINNQANKAKTDWKTAFQTAIENSTTSKDVLDNTQVIWDQYFEEEWANYDDTAIKALKANLSNLQKELEYYGYNSKYNPFVQFLQVMLKKTDFATNITTNYTSYATLHNAVADKLISSKDLLGTGVLGQVNIIFRPKLYAESYATMSEHLQLQYLIELIFKTKNPFKDQELQNQDDNDTDTEQHERNWLNSKYENKLQNFIADTFYAGGSPFEDEKAISLTPDTLDTLNIKSTAEIQKIIDLCFKASTVQNAQETVDRMIADGSTNKITVTNTNYQEALKQVKKAINDNAKLTNKQLAYKKALWTFIKANNKFTEIDKNKFINNNNIFDIRNSSDLQTNNDILKYLKDTIFTKYNIDKALNDSSLATNIINSMATWIAKDKE